jgi:hypothetical protein
MLYEMASRESASSADMLELGGLSGSGFNPNRNPEP